MGPGKPYGGKIYPLPDRRIICSQLQAGTRLVAVLNVNQSSHEEINYGTGKGGCRREYG